MELKHTVRDFDAYFDALKLKATEVFTTWENFTDSNIGVLFLELFSMLGDQSSFYLNRSVNELFLPTVQKRRNAILILERMDYEMAGRKPASTDETFTLTDGVHTKDVFIPKNSNIQTTDGKSNFQTVEDFTILAGETEGDVAVENRNSGYQILSFDNTSFQEKIINQENFIDDVDETVLFIDSLLWTRVDDFLDSSPTDRHFKITFDDNLNAILLFSDGIRGAIPDGDGDLNFKYGGGVDGNAVEKNTITKILAPIYDIDSLEMAVTATNDDSPSAGSDEESIDEARAKAPKQNRSSSDRTIARDDYEGNSESVDGVARALSVGYGEDQGLLPNIAYIYIVPEGGGAPSTALKDDVENVLLVVKPVPQTSGVNILDGIYTDVTVSGAITKKGSFLAADVKTAVDLALTTFFKYENLDEENKHTIDFGYYIPILYESEITGVILNAKINGIKCVENVTLTSPIANINVPLRNIPELQDLSGLLVT